MTFSPLCLHQRTAITSPNLNMSPIVNFQTFFATQRKSPGPDSLPPRILKECASILSSPLCFFFNKSFSTGKLPHLWKLANITPLFKKGSKTDRNNYRRISLTSIMCKIAEKIVKSRGMDFWRDINILNPNQFTYMEGRSTLSELLSCYDDWAK